MAIRGSCHCKATAFEVSAAPENVTQCTCSFCSIHTFYRNAPGKVVRTRNPARVVEEMRWLWKARGISIFLFQDDDFLAEAHRRQAAGELRR